MESSSTTIDNTSACVCEGQSKSYRYTAGPYLLAADLHRPGFHLRKPPIFKSVLPTPPR
jgi:hypothetical protein